MHWKVIFSNLGPFSLLYSDRDLYFVFVLKFLESYGYFALSQILVIYLHDEFGATDIQAGAIYGTLSCILQPQPLCCCMSCKSTL